MMISQTLIRVLDDQIVFLFTGRINLINKLRNRIEITLKLIEGDVIFARSGEKLGITSIMSFLEENISEDDSKFIFSMEPEIIDPKIRNIYISYTEILEKIKNLLDKALNLKKLRPPNSLSFQLSKDFFNRTLDIDIGLNDFEVIKHLIDSSSVSYLYKKSMLTESEVTEVLLKFKKYGLIQVFS